MILFVVIFTLWPRLDLTVSAADSSSPVSYVDQTESAIICASKTCINRCCAEGEYLQCDSETYVCSCNIHDVVYDFSTVQLYSNKIYGEKVDTKFTEAFVVIPSFFSNASDEFKMNGISSSKLPQSRTYLGTDGKLQLESPNAYERWTIYGTDNYCVDFVDTDYDFYVLLLSLPETDNTIYVYAMFVSSFFLMLVLVVYALLPDLRNLPGKILMAYVLSQIIAFISLSMIQILSFLPPISCVILTAIVYDSFLSSFCWMNVMSYDIFWTFRSYAKARVHRTGENFKFAMYCLYAWGVPLALTAMMLMMQYADFSDKPWIIKPLINDRGCFLMEGQKFVYLYLPILILIICNWVFFLLTVFNIWRVSRATAVVRSPASGNAAAHRAHKLRFVLYIKLSLIMGVNWLLEVISSFYPQLNGWWVTDMYNLLIGFFIFLIFVLRMKIYKDLQAKFSRVRLNRWSATNSTINSTTTTSDVSQDITLQVSQHPRGSGRDKNFERNI
ncbi:G-protein coupled receptor Mth2-like [Aricia agestis]|uniref:G-protein coupled receptor Mth2-like n=1 Tax=Aricia agestis TaxID=91739 RepID=UPI001C202919|nr:G-protein coupled receptor Mth2-like [Aricia agestis]